MGNNSVEGETEEVVVALEASRRPSEETVEVDSDKTEECLLAVGIRTIVEVIVAAIKAGATIEEATIINAEVEWEVRTCLCLEVAVAVVATSMLAVVSAAEEAEALITEGRAQEVDSKTRTPTTKLSNASSLKEEEIVLMETSAHSRMVHKNF